MASTPKTPAPKVAPPADVTPVDAHRTLVTRKLPEDTQLRVMLIRAVAIIKELPRHSEHDDAKYNAFLADAEKVLG